MDVSLKEIAEAKWGKTDASAVRRARNFLIRNRLFKQDRPGSPRYTTERILREFDPDLVLEVRRIRFRDE